MKAAAVVGTLVGAGLAVGTLVAVTAGLHVVVLCLVVACALGWLSARLEAWMEARRER